MQSITVKQEKNILYVYTNEKYIKFSLKSRDTDVDFVSIGDTKFFLDLSELLNFVKEKNTANFSLVYREKESVEANSKLVNVRKSSIVLEGLGSFVVGDKSVAIYIGKDGALRANVNKLVNDTNYLKSPKIESKIIGKPFCFTFSFSLNHVSVKKVNVIVRDRYSCNSTRVSLPVVTKKINLWSTRCYVEFDYKVCLEDFSWKNREIGEIIDFYAEVVTSELSSPLCVKIGRPNYIAENRRTRALVLGKGKNIQVFTPYFTLKGRNLAFYYSHLDFDAYTAYEYSISKKCRLKKIFKKNKKIWVVGEKRDKAQDNGFFFFKYMRENYPERDVYYVIQKNSVDAAKVEELGNVIYYQSKEHFYLMTNADAIFTTHHPEHIYPLRSEEYKRSVSGTKIFLQHGVLGIKNLERINGRKLKDFNVDLFIVSSFREKQIVTRDLKYKPKQVAVTGLARFDSLLEKCDTKKRILISPTWRDWLTDATKVKESGYLREVNSILNMPALLELHEEGYEIVLCLHPNIQFFKNLFDIPKHVKLVGHGSESVQALIKKSTLMITDYSSVSFDFSFCGKPVIYCFFDHHKFLGKERSHLDLRNELPGHIVYNVNDLNEKVRQLKENNFSMSKELSARKNNFITFLDCNNSERIREAAESLIPQQKGCTKILLNNFWEKLFNRFRRSKFYFKVMRLFNFVVKCLHPVRKDTIVFESNLGKSVADSPKAIYDEIKARNLRYRIVWVSNQNFPFDDENVVVVKRLSPAYFYYLSVAGFWVNNQNFPGYILKKKITKYIQTWHGTPLKRMLHDLDNITGRDGGYANRVSSAISKWDYLLSSSSYTTANFRTAFKYQKDILEFGYPRDDQLIEGISDEEVVSLKNWLGIPKDKKVVLYVPTFRDNFLTGGKSESLLDIIDARKLKASLNDSHVLLVRSHIIDKSNSSVDSDLDGFVINVSNHDNLEEILLISDICITDYSSVMFDYSITRKPLVFFTYDYDFYKDNLRGFYFDLKEVAPGPVVDNVDDLLFSILNVENEKHKYADKYERFCARFNEFNQGSAAKKVVDLFF